MAANINSNLTIKQGTTSKRIAVFIENSASLGTGLTALVFNSAGLVAYYWREDEGNVNATAITLATMTRGTWATGGFIEKDATNVPGWYEIGVPNAALASGARWVVIMLKGATNMAQTMITIHLNAQDPGELATGSIAATTFAAGAIDAAAIANAAIDAATFAAGAIDAAAIAADAITAAKVAAGTIDAATFAAGAIDAAAIANGAIDAATFAAGAIDAAAIANAAIDAATFAAGAIDAAAIANGAIDAATFAAGAIDAAAIANAAIDAATFAAGAIDAASIAADAITAAKIAAGAIDAATFAAGAIDAAAIANSAIDAATFAAGAIDAAAIANAAIDRATFAADTGLQTIRSNTATAGAAGTITLDAAASAVNDFYNGSWIYLTGGTGVGQARLITDYVGATQVATISPNWATNPAGDTTFAITGTNEVRVNNIADNAITAASINADAITAAKVANGAIDAATFAAGAIDAAAIANGAIDAATFAAGAIDAAAIANSAIDAATFAAGAIDAAAIAANAIGASELATDAVSEIADGLMQRASSNWEAAADKKSLGAAVMKLVHKTDTAAVAGQMLIYRSDGTTEHARQATTTDATVDPIKTLGGAA